MIKGAPFKFRPIEPSSDRLNQQRECIAAKLSHSLHACFYEKADGRCTQDHSVAEAPCRRDGLQAVVINIAVEIIRNAIVLPLCSFLEDQMKLEVGAAHHVYTYIYMRF